MSTTARALRHPHPYADLKVIRRRRRSKSLIKRADSRRLAPLLVLAAIGVGAIVFAILLEQVVLAQSAFQLDKVRRELVAAEAEHEELLLQAAKLDSAARIERYARTTLGMVDPAPDQVRYIVADVRTRRVRSGAAVASGPYPSAVSGVATGTSP